MATDTSDPRITTESRGHVFLIGLARPAKMNAFDPPMLEQLGAAFTELESNPQHRCGVLFAHGDHFTAGLDLGKVAPLVADGKTLFPAGEVDPFSMSTRPRTKPVVCAVQGRCLTIGIELALAQDITIASDDTRFAQIEIKRGIFPFGGGTIRWVSRCGWGNAMRWILTGDELDAAEAHRIGLVQEVVPKGKQLERAIAIAETIAAQAPLGVQATLRNARLAAEGSFRDAVSALMPEIMHLMKTDDAREGLMSFLERRAAKFEGR
jgi:enoyl-CoA hydratase/carnithine racemase